jgi:hypothetical protein
MLNASAIPFETTGWPSWLQAIAPQLWLALLGLTLIVVSYGLGFATKKIVRSIGRRRYSNEDLFVGSSWDLAAPVCPSPLNLGQIDLSDFGGLGRIEDGSEAVIR